MFTLLKAEVIKREIRKLVSGTFSLITQKRLYDLRIIELFGKA
jgi:hypothetical protein